MEDKEIIIKDFNLGITLRNELQRLGLRNHKYSDMEYQKFKLSELRCIKKLVIAKGTKNIDGIQYLTNLKDLTIKSSNAKETSSFIKDDAEYNYLMNQIHIDDYSFIEDLQNLQYLTISNSGRMTSIDVSKLQNLTVLELSNNSNLTQVKGLDKCHNLIELKLDRNNIKNSFDIESLIKNHNLNNIKLDFNLFPILNTQNPNLGAFLSEQQKNGISTRWVENFSNLGLIEITTNKMIDIHNSATTILDSVIEEYSGEMEMIAAIYLYINQNIKYDYDGLNNREGTATNNTLAVYSETKEQRSMKINSSYNAFMEHKCVCEGYTNMMRYLLTCCRIDSRTVGCRPKKDTNANYVYDNSNHSIIRIKIANEWYYFDPTWDASKSTLRFFFKTKEEIEESHVLSVSEEKIKTPPKKAYTNEELSIMMNNALTYQADIAKTR